MKPEPFPTGLVATHDRRIRRQAEPSLRRRDLELEPLDIPCRNLATASSLSRSRREPHLPVLLGEFECHHQHRTSSRLGLTGRRCCHTLLLDCGHHHSEERNSRGPVLSVTGVATSRRALIASPTPRSR